MFRIAPLLVVTLTASPLVAGPVDRAALAAQAKEIFRRHCAECHGGAKARGGVSILDHAALLKKEKVIPGRPDDSLVYQVITATDETAMPPKGRPALDAFQIAVIRRWIAAGTPAFPDDAPKPPEPEAKKDAALRDVAGVDYVLKKILTHVEAAPAKQVPFLRFFSINHVLTAGATSEKLGDHRLALAKAINHMSREPKLVRPQSIDSPADTVFAVDIRELGWDARPFRVGDGDSARRSDLTLFDLALLEYPYAIAYEDSETFARLADRFLATANQVRPVPYVRADWFVSVATLPPLYDDFLQLPLTLSELEKQLGVKSADNLESGKARRAGMTVSGVSRNNRVVERHPARDGWYWKSFDFRTSKGPENVLKDPLTFKESGGEMIFRLPNGLQAYYVCDANGKRLDAAPTEIVVDKFAADKIVRNGLGCIRCHDQGMKEFADVVRPALAALPGRPGFDKQQVLDLYPPQEEMDKFVAADRDSFQKALKELLGDVPAREPLVPVTTGYVDDALGAPVAAGELGLDDAAKLTAVARVPQFTGMGLAPLASGGVVRRDAWEDNYDQAVRGLGLGTPLVAIDGSLRRDHPAGTLGDEVEFKTNKANNFFEPGDTLEVSVTNKSAKPLHVELIGTSVEGKKVLITSKPEVVQPGGTFKLPPQKIRAKLGKEQITLLASHSEFPAAELLRGDGVADRVIHRFYKLTTTGGRARVAADAAAVVKKTIDIETR